MNLQKELHTNIWSSLDPFVVLYNMQWSFGVTCWEVFTCGAVPYPGLNPLNVQRELKLGRRLERPKNTVCSDEIWSMLLRCWSDNPRDRPNFPTLEEILFNLLDSDPTYINLIS
jgi:serine/threonine protein kinase